MYNQPANLIMLSYSCGGHTTFIIRPKAKLHRSVRGFIRMLKLHASQNFDESNVSNFCKVRQEKSHDQEAFQI